MQLIRRAFNIFREEGLRTLAHRSRLFFKYRVFNILHYLPQAKTKTLIARSRFLTTLYFYIRGSFYQEQRTLLHGQIKYLREEETELENPGENPVHKIIRDTHRIEKGISMQDRKDTFAGGYVRELVGAVETAWKNETDIDEKQLKWATDVLAKYFDIVESTPRIEKAKQQFQALIDDIEYVPNDRIPAARKEFEQDIPSFDAVKRLAKQRSSTRWFKQEPVPHDLIDDAIEVAAQSPSACNRQSYEFRIYDDPELLDKLLELPIGVRGYADNIPCAVVLVGKQGAYFHDRDKHVIYIDASLAAMSFQFALESLGLASCSINWPALQDRERRLEDLINLDPDETAIMFIAVGYPNNKGKVPYSEKKSISSLRSINKKD